MENFSELEREERGKEKAYWIKEIVKTFVWTNKGSIEMLYDYIYIHKIFFVGEKATPSRVIKNTR